MTPAIAAALARGELIVTANNRLARNLRTDFDRQQLAAGRQVWRSATVIPWTAWVRRLWWQAQSRADAARKAGLLTDFQARLAWQAVIERDPASREAWASDSSRAVADLAFRSWSTAQAWRIDAAMLAAAADSSDSEVFARWAVAYRELCRKQRCIDEASVPPALAGAPPAAAHGHCRPVRLVGFSNSTPAQQALIAALNGSGWTVQSEDIPRIEDARIRQVRCEDPVQEMTLAARWARQAGSHDRAARVAVVVPDLGPRREVVRRIFRDIFIPGWSDEGHACVAPVNVSLGSNLAGTGIIHAGLLLLRVLCAELDYREVSQLLRSPFLGGTAAEREKRVQFDLVYRDRLGLTTPVPRVLDELDAAALLIGARLRTALAAAGSDTPRLPSAWIRVLSTFLVNAGWPGDETPGSEQYQALRAWHELLDEFAASDAVTAPIRRTEAVRRLTQLAREQVFQPETHSDGVQVMGLLEALGQSFDQLWICGLTADKWPPPARPDALLPLQLQREMGLPDSSPERSRERAEGILDALSHSAPEVYLSWARRDRDELFDASPLIHAHTAIDSEEISFFRESTRSVQLFDEGPELLSRADVAPPVGPLERLSGGTRLIELQSGCPARAFLEMRLGAFELATPTSGSNPRLRGLIVHEALRRIFTEVRSSEELDRIQERDLTRRVRDSVEKAVASAIPPRGAVAMAVALIELDLCSAMVGEFLRTERLRSPFTIREIETDREAEFGGLLLRVRPDRVDDLDAETRLVIDFKTGDVTRGLWLGARPQEPQLPIYALVLDARAVAFVQLRRSGVRWIGVAARELGIEGISEPPALRDRTQKYPDWTALQSAWRQRLLALAGEILGGDARIQRFQRNLAEGQWAMLTRIFDSTDAEDVDAERAE